MKRIWWGPLLGVLVLLLAAVPAFASSSDNPGKNKGPIDKIVFIHYPKHETVKPSGGDSAGGVLSTSFKYTGIHWFNMPVYYYVNPDGSGLSADITSSAVQVSFVPWDVASNNLQFVKAGISTAAAGTADGMNIVSWADINRLYPKAIAVTSIWYYRNSKEIAEVDTQMNNGNGFSWSYTEPVIPASPAFSDPSNTGAPATAYDIRNIMTHEAGHWIMLGDLYNSRDSYLTMYGYGSTGELKKDTLGNGDLLGTLKAYP